MLKKLYFLGQSGSGKTTIALAIAQLCKDDGLKVAYLKPKAAERFPHSNGDMDISLFKTILELPQSPATIAPFWGETNNLKNNAEKKHGDLAQISKVDESFREMGRSSDILLIEGGKTPWLGCSLGIDDLTLAKKWGVGLLLVSALQKDEDIDWVLFYNHEIVSRGLVLLGNIFNNVPPDLLERARVYYRPLLEQRGYTVLGVIPTHPGIAFPTVAEFLQALGGEILTGEENLGLPVEEIVIGTMTIEGALRYLRRALHKAVVTGGDRSDMALSALETSISVLILTGGLYPDVRVISRAQEKGVPVILVPFDTYTAIGRLGGLVRQIRPEDISTIDLIKEAFVQHCSWDTINRII